MNLHKHPDFPDHVMTESGVMVYVPLRKKLKTRYEVVRNSNMAYCIIKCSDGIRRKVYHEDFVGGVPILDQTLTHEKIFQEWGGRPVPGFEDYAIDGAGVVYRVKPYRKWRGRRVPFVLHPASRFSKEYLVLQEKNTGKRVHMSVDKIKLLVEEEAQEG